MISNFECKNGGTLDNIEIAGTAGTDNRFTYATEPLMTCHQKCQETATCQTFMVDDNNLCVMYTASCSTGGAEANNGDIYAKSGFYEAP
jgi:hypothetical protein